MTPCILCCLHGYMLISQSSLAHTEANQPQRKNRERHRYATQSKTFPKAPFLQRKHHRNHDPHHHRPKTPLPRPRSTPIPTPTPTPPTESLQILLRLRCRDFRPPHRALHPIRLIHTLHRRPHVEEIHEHEARRFPVHLGAVIQSGSQRTHSRLRVRHIHVRVVGLLDAEYLRAVQEVVHQEDAASRVGSGEALGAIRRAGILRR